MGGDETPSSEEIRRQVTEHVRSQFASDEDFLNHIMPKEDFSRKKKNYSQRAPPDFVLYHSDVVDEEKSGVGYAADPGNLLQDAQAINYDGWEEEEALFRERYKELRDVDVTLGNGRAFEFEGDGELAEPVLAALAYKAEAEVTRGVLDERGKWVYRVFFENDTLPSNLWMFREVDLRLKTESSKLSNEDETLLKDGEYLCRGKVLSKDTISRLERRLACTITPLKGDSEGKAEYLVVPDEGWNFPLYHEWRLKDVGLELVLSEEERNRIVEEGGLPW